ncbi:thymidylate synthase [Stenotrophomonas phage Sonora]|nr:thymidylate synthase [Stenotrophomonas phage Sonora]
MKVIHVRNVQQALPEGIRSILIEGIPRESRNGPVLAFDTPVTTVYENPRERVIFHPERDANPFFHLVESLWMLDGRNDVESLAFFVERMRSFSDDGTTFHGAYGHRWRYQFGGDQLTKIIAALKADKTDRRQVLSMWDARTDLGRVGKDLPCNLQAVFQITASGHLDMMVTNRSNDMIWGAYGANAVHFSYLHEFIATAVDVEVGRYRQVSANFHAYTDVLEKVKSLGEMAEDIYDPYRSRRNDPYFRGEVEPYPLMSIEPERWLAELRIFLSEGPVMGLRDPFFRRVATPVVRAYQLYKSEKGAARYDKAIEALADCAATDWRKACVEWIERRRAAAEERARRERAKDDGPAYE